MDFPGMNILSIQSRVAYGHVGNAAAQFTLQRLGHTVWPVETAYLSNHLGYKTWRGRFPDAAEVAEVVTGLDELGVLATCDAVLSGYLGAVGNGDTVANAVRAVRAKNPSAVYACDPVMGDLPHGLFVKPEVPPIFADRLLPLANFAFPNAYELEYLTGGKTNTLAVALSAADAFLAKMRAGGTVVITSLLREDGPADSIETLAVSKDAAWVVATPRYNAPPHGAGDCFAALFLGHYLYMRDLEFTLGFAATAIHAVIVASAEAGTEELLLVPTQDRLRPTKFDFPPQRVR
jgi:pyridoxine kinase